MLIWNTSFILPYGSVPMSRNFYNCLVLDTFAKISPMMVCIATIYELGNYKFIYITRCILKHNVNALNIY